MDKQRNPYGLSAKHKEAWINHNNRMAFFESNEQMTQMEERDELQVPKGVLTVNDEELLSLFNSPVEQTVEVGWEP